MMCWHKKGVCPSDSLRAENARLQAEVEEVQGSLMEAREEVQRLQMCEGMARDIAAERDALQARVEGARLVEADREIATKRTVKLLRTERDRYKALAERRKEALEATGNDLARLHDGDVSNYGLEIRAMLRRANAAIALTLETARAAIEEEEK